MNHAALRKHIQKLVQSGLMLALCLLLPFLTGQIPQVGSMLLPMHLPVLLCGYLCGAPWAALVGFAAPPVRYLLFGMPPLFPVGLAMAVEMAVYGAVVGLVWPRVRHKGTKGVFAALLAAQLLGRLAWGAAQFVLLGLTGGQFTFALFLAGAFTSAAPGVVLQWVLVPVLVAALRRANVME